MPDDRRDTMPSHDEDAARHIDRDVGRKLKARAEGRRGVWFGLGMFGLVGWSVSVPTVVGLVIGLWLDGQFPGRVSWTLTFLIIGVAVGCLNAWYWVQHESRPQ
jgi:ATP synthase protein I